MAPEETTLSVGIPRLSLTELVTQSSNVQHERDSQRFLDSLSDSQHNVSGHGQRRGHLQKALNEVGSRPYFSPNGQPVIPFPDESSSHKPYLI